MDIKNAAAIVTGGASGMGAATAHLLAQCGAKVTILDTNRAAADQLAKSIKGRSVYCDVTQRDSVAQAVQEAAEYHGPARICINCAGIVHSRRMVNKQGMMPLDEFRHVIDVNLVGTFNVMAHVVHMLIPLPLAAHQEERGVVINTASIAAYEGQIGQTAYAASKGGIISLTLPAARELAQFGIRVMTVAPGLVDTPMFGKIADDTRMALASSVPFPKRLADPKEYAALVQHIIENAMLNGTVIRLDGGLRMQPS